MKAFLFRGIVIFVLSFFQDLYGEPNYGFQCKHYFLLSTTENTQPSQIKVIYKLKVRTC